MPRHIAIIMDGNGRWAQQRYKPRAFGHKAGVDALRATIESCSSLGVEVLTVFAFSSENWSRPTKEVEVLMSLFMLTLKSQAKRLHKNNIRLKVIGDRARFSPSLQSKILEVESLTEGNSGLTLVVA
ncbi:MAG TPA: di-trans,poly-cis-decaprenylcistransferase, partial [Cycloclasticus sp.]|nr:di-trans,poly-cis-decaprenylcistransferase [Cycloclasticus sp.]